MRCCLPDCRNDTSRGTENDRISFHRFPKGLRLRNLWIEALGIVGWEPDQSSTLCSAHFTQDAFYETKGGVRRVKRNAIPGCNIEISTVLEIKHIKNDPDEKEIDVEKDITIKQELPDDKDDTTESYKPNNYQAQQKDKMTADTEIIKQEIDEEKTEHAFLEILIKQELPDDNDTVEKTEENCAALTGNTVADTAMDDCPTEKQEISVKKSLVKCQSKKKVTREANSLKQCEKQPKQFDDNSFSCTFCDYRCTSKRVLLKHIKVHSGEKPFTCQICDYRCVHKKILATHLLCHSGEGMPFACQICGYRCVQKKNLSRHMLSHTGERPFACQICDYRCKQKTHLNTHMITHTVQKEFECDICNYKYKQKSNLITHMRTHTGETPYGCQICNYRCIRKISLTRHMMSHTGVKPFACKICNNRFTHKEYVNAHMRTHTGEKPFACQLCSYRSVRSTTLTRHIKTHSRERPFLCAICNYKCKQKSTLAAHIRNNHIV